MMPLILALSVIILHHVDSYSCRSIIRKLDDLHLKSAEDSTEIYELKNEEILELLHPLVKSGQAETPKHLTLQKNLAKLTIEPYLEGNQTSQWQRIPYSRFNNQKTIAPLAIILTHLPDLKSKQAQGNILKKNYVIDKSGNKNLYLSSRVTNEKTQFQPFKPNIYKHSLEGLININTDEERQVVPDAEGKKEISFKTDFVDSKTSKPVVSEISSKVVTNSKGVLSTEDQDSSDLYNNESQENYTEVESQITPRTDKIMDEDSTIENKKPLENDKSNADESALHVFTIDLKDLNYKDNSVDDKTHRDIVSVSSKETSSIVQDREQSQELKNQQHQEYSGKDLAESEFDSLKATKSSTESDSSTLEISNIDQINLKTNEPESRGDVTENSFTYNQTPLKNFQKFIDLGSYEGRNGGESIEIVQSPNQDYLPKFDDKFILESGEKLSKEHVLEDSHESQHMKLYIPEEDSYREDKTFSAKPIEQIALKNSERQALDSQEHFIPEHLDEDIKNENPTEDPLHKSQTKKEGLKYWHHVRDGRRSHNVYNLCFHFNR